MAQALLYPFRFLTQILNNMNTIKILALPLAAASMMALSVHANTITGSVDMSGTVFLDNTHLGSAKSATGFTGVTVGGLPDGSYTGTAGSSVTWNAFGWNPSTAPVSPLWTFTSGGRTYSFDLGNVTIKSQDNTFLNLLGSGTLNITGSGPSYSPTSGSWSFTISNPTGGAKSNFAFTFANSQTAAVPDGGASAMLLGLGVLGLGMVRRKTS